MYCKIVIYFNEHVMENVQLLFTQTEAGKDKLNSINPNTKKGIVIAEMLMNARLALDRTISAISSTNGEMLSVEEDCKHHGRLNSYARTVFERLLNVWNALKNLQTRHTKYQSFDNLIKLLMCLSKEKTESHVECILVY